MIVLMPGTKTVEKITRRGAGPKLVQFIRTHYPKFHTYMSSVATVKDQGSSIAVQDDTVYVMTNLNESRVACHQPYRTAHHRQAHLPVRLDDDTPPTPENMILLHRGDMRRYNLHIIAPSLLRYKESSTMLDESDSLPVEEWYTSPLQAYEVMKVYNDVDPLDIRRTETHSLHGWPIDENRGGSHVRVRLANNRWVMK